jgi:hypothetical protein
MMELERTEEVKGLAMTRAQGKETEKRKESEQAPEEKGTEKPTKPKPAYCFEPKLQNSKVAQDTVAQKTVPMF